MALWIISLLSQLVIVSVCLFLSVFTPLKFTDLHSFHVKVPKYGENNEIPGFFSRKYLDFGRLSRLQQ